MTTENLDESILLIVLSLLVFILPPFRRVYFSENQKIIDKGVDKKRLFYIDFLRGISIIAVIIIHVGYLFYNQERGNEYFLSVWNNILRFAVPFFLITSGLLLNMNSSPMDFYLKKLMRTAIPFIIVSIIIGLFYNETAMAILKSFITGSASPPYYFIPVLFQLYLIYPILEKYSKSKYFLQSSLLFSLIFFLHESSWFIFGVPTFMKYLFFFAYGIFQKRKIMLAESEPRKDEIFCWTLVVAFYFFYSAYTGAYFYNASLFYAIAVFNLFLFLKDRITRWRPYGIISYIGRNSLWIYLVHYFLLEQVYELIIKDINNFYFEYAMLLIISIPLSIVASIFIKKIYDSIFSATTLLVIRKFAIK